MSSSAVLASTIVVDKTAPKNEQATLLKTANNIPQVNIQTPSTAGVSINQYQQFDVEQRGVILNNSHQNAQTQLAGWIQGNPWLAGAEAKIIVNQINSTNPSMLKGAIEIAGRRAEVIIANPTGIQVDGGHFINAKGVVLSTAHPRIEQGQLKGYGSPQATIEIQGVGLNSQNSDYTQLISRQIRINAPIWGNHLKITASEQTLDQNAEPPSHFTQNNQQPSYYAIDTGLLGGMYAGKITLISSEANADIYHQGQMLAKAGEVVIDAQGKLINQGSIIAAAQTPIDEDKNTSITINAHDLENTGLLAASKDLNIRLTESYQSQSDLYAGQSLNLSTQKNIHNAHQMTGLKSLHLQSQNLTQESTGILQSGQILSIKTIDTTNNQGLINSEGLNHIQSHILTNEGTGRIYGNHIAIAVNKLNNQEDTNNAAIIAAREHLSIAAKEILNKEGALLNSEGSLAIGGALNERQIAIGQAEQLDNISARIEAQGDAYLSVKKLNNLNPHLKLEEYLADRSRQIKEYAQAGSSTYYKEGEDGYFDNSRGKKDQSEANFIFKDGTKITARNWHVKDYHIDTYQQRVIESRPAELIIGNNLIISGENWLNQDSQILVGGLLNNTNALSLENKETLGQGRKEYIGRQWNSTVKKSFYKRKRRPRRFETDHRAYQKTETFTHALIPQIARLQQNAPALQINNLTTLANLAINNLYRITPNHPDYLIETDPAYTQYRYWLGSDYMLKAFNQDPNNIHKRLADGYYEQKLINEQIIQGTGHRRLEGYQSDEEQYKALMNAGITFAKAQQLTPGIALTAEQIQRLTSDIVWLESQTIIQEDGTTHTVLVPKVYLLAREGDLNRTGSLISAEQIQLNLQHNSLSNQGSISGRKIINLQAHNVNNQGQIHGQTIALKAEDNIHIKGGSIQAQEQLQLQAKNIHIESSTKSSDTGQTQLDRIAGLYLTDKAKGHLSLIAQENLTLNAVQIQNQSQQGQTYLEANNIELGTINTQQQERYGNLGDKNHRYIKQSVEIGSQIYAQNDIILNSHNNLSLKQAQLDSEQGKIQLYGKDIEIKTGRSQLELDESFYSKSKGMLSSQSDYWQYQKQHEEATGSAITGKEIHIQAQKDLSIEGSQIISDQQTTLLAQGNIKLQSAQNKYHSKEHHQQKKSGFSASLSKAALSIGYNKSHLNLDYDAQYTRPTQSQIGSLYGSTQILAEKQIHTEAVNIYSGADLLLKAKEITLGHAYAIEKQQQSIETKTSGINITFDLKPLELRQIEKRIQGIQEAKAQTSAQQKNNKWHDASIKSVMEAFNAPIKLQIGTNKSNSEYYQQETHAILSNLQTGGNLTIQAQENDINIKGAHLFSEQNLNLIAKNNIIINSAEEHIQSYYQSKQKYSGLKDMGQFSLFIGSQENQIQEQQNGIRHKQSTIKTIMGDSYIQAGNHYQQNGSEIYVGKDLNITAQNINIRAIKAPYSIQQTESNQQKGLTIALDTPISHLIEKIEQINQNIGQIHQNIEQIGESKNARINAMAAANTAWNAYRTKESLNQAKESLSQMVNGNLAQGSNISVSISYGEQKNIETTAIQGHTAKSSTINAGNQVYIQATGRDTSDINIIGSDVSGKQGTWLQADNKVNLLAAQQNHQERSENKSSGFNAGVAISYGSNGFAFGVTAGGNYGKGYGNGDEITWVNSHVGDKESNTVIKSGRETNIKGAQVQGKGIQLSAENLNIESLQDTMSYVGKQMNIQGQITVGYGASGSASYNQSKINADYASVQEQSGLFAGDEGYQIHIKEHTDLKGSLITSKQDAENKNQLLTGTLSFSDIYNYSHYEGKSFGIGASATISGNTLGQGENYNPEQNLTNIADKNSFNKSVGYGEESARQTSITKSGINTQNIQITNEAEQIKQIGLNNIESIAKIYTPTTTDSTKNFVNHLKNNFDKDAVQNSLDLQRNVRQEFDRNRQSLKQQIYADVDQKRAEATEIRRQNKGYDNKAEEAATLDKKANQIDETMRWIDAGLALIWGSGNSDMAWSMFTTTQADRAIRAGTRPKEMWFQKEEINTETGQTTIDTRQIWSLNDLTEEELASIQDENGNIITISNPGIFNNRFDSLKNASKQNKKETKEKGVIVIMNPPTGKYSQKDGEKHWLDFLWLSSSLISELMYVGYDQLNNKVFQGYLPLTNSEKLNQDIYYEAKSRGWLVDTSNHSRGGITASVALKNWVNNKDKNGIAPIRKGRFYGTATNVKNDYADILQKNGYTYIGIDGKLYNSGAYSIVHNQDAIGNKWTIWIPPFILLGNNDTTRGACKKPCYPHSAYNADVPERYQRDEENQYIIINNNFIETEDWKEYIKIWGEPTEKDENGNYINTFIPKLVLPNKSNGEIYEENPF